MNYNCVLQHKMHFCVLSTSSHGCAVSIGHYITGKNETEVTKNVMRVKIHSAICAIKLIEVNVTTNNV